MASTNDITREYRTREYPMCPMFEYVGYVRQEFVNGELKPVCVHGFNEHHICGKCSQFCHNVRYVSVDMQEHPFSRTVIMCVEC